MALLSNGRLLVRHASVAHASLTALAAPFQLANYALEPLFRAPVTPPHASLTGMAVAAPLTWSLAKPSATVQQNPWDVAHQAAAPRNYADYVEPDIIHAPAGSSAAARAATPAAVAPPTLNTHYPPPGAVSPGWHLGQDFAGFDNIRRLATGKGVRIAHVDTGYTPAHISTPRFIKPEFGWNFWDDNSNTTDPGEQLFGTEQPGHGTATLALLAGNTMDLQFDGETYQGDIGGAPDAEVVPVRIGPTVYHFYSSAMARGLQYALAPRGDTAERCQVVSLSHGGLPSAAWADAVNQLYEAGVVLVAASGDNFYSPVLNLPTRFTIYPSAFNRAITAVGITFARTPYQTTTLGVMQGSWGPPAVMKKAVAAYTPNVAWMNFKQVPDGFDMTGGGTSAATPQIAAACALWMELYGARFAAGWPVVEACRLALFKSCGTPAVDPALGWGGLNVPAMLDQGLADALVAEYAAHPFQPSAADTASFPFWRELFGEPPAGSAQEAMYDTEVAQIVLSSDNPALIRLGQQAASGGLGAQDRADMIAALKTETISDALRARLDKG